MSETRHILNLGPQHPASHGALRIILELEGEIIKRADPHIGMLHRGTEKLMETKPFNQNIGYMDRLDYVSMLCNEHAYVLAIEKLLGIVPPPRAQYIRVLFDEATRILNHLLWLGAHALDLGAMALFLYGFRERETLLDCYEAVSGARMHANYYRPGGVHRDLPRTMPQYHSDLMSPSTLKKRNADRAGSLVDFMQAFVDRFPRCIDEYESLLTDNPLWQQRTQGVGVVTRDQALAWGLTGPMLRASGVAWDLRKKQPYAVYEQLQFQIPVGTQGDCFERYCIRIAEMRQSTHLMGQCLSWLRDNPGPVSIDDPKHVPPSRRLLHSSMEALIEHFKLFSEGYCVPEGEVYAAVEHPKGEFGVHLISDGANKPYRLKIRGASFAHLAAFDAMVRGHSLSDAVAIIGTQDLVMGEIDR